MPDETPDDDYTFGDEDTDDAFDEGDVTEYEVDGFIMGTTDG